MLPNNRQLKKLWEVLVIIRNWKSCNQNKISEGDKITRIETISDWIINDERVWYFPLSEVDKKKFSILKGDILFSHINSPVHIWKVAIAKKDYDDMFHWMNLLLLRWNERIIDPEFLFNLLNWIFHKWEREKICKKAINQASLNQKNILEKEIPLPPLEEQKKIIAYLDELNATISKLKSEYQSQLAMLDEMRNSSLELAFLGSRERAYNLNNWKWVKLGEVCEILDSKRKPITQKDRIDWPYPYYWATWIVDYVNDYLFDEKLVLIWEDWAKWGSGDNTAFSVEGKIWVNNHVHVLRPFRKQLCDDFLIYYLLIRDLSEYITGTTVPKLNQEKLKNIEIPLPDLEMQSQIVAHLDQVHQQITMLKTQVNSQIEHCDELWQSCLEKVLTQGME